MTSTSSLFRRLSEESYLSVESTSSFDSLVDVPLYESEISASLDNLSVAFGLVQEARAAAAVAGVAEAAASEQVIGGFALRAAFTAPELAVPLLLGFGAYELYSWLGPKGSKPVGNSPQPVKPAPPVNPAVAKTTPRSVNQSPAVLWREVRPGWVRPSRRHRR